MSVHQLARQASNHGPIVYILQISKVFLCRFVYGTNVLFK